MSEEEKNAMQWLKDWLAGTHVHPNSDTGRIILSAMERLAEADETIEFLRKQSRGHFEALSVVLRDGVEALIPDPADLNPPGPKKAN